MGKIQKVYTREKKEAVWLAETSGKPIAQIARELGSPIRPFTGGRGNYQNPVQRRFLEVGIKPRLRRKFVV